jgi:RNA recognition motif-containing protein
MGARYVTVAPSRPVGAAAAAPARPRPRGCATLFVKGLPYEATEEELAAAFTPFGSLLNARLSRWQHTGRTKGFGYVQFKTGEGAEAAMAAAHRAGGLLLGGRALTVDWESAAPRASFKLSDGQHWSKVNKEALAALRSAATQGGAKRARRDRAVAEDAAAAATTSGAGAE